MKTEQIRKLLELVAEGDMGADDALESLKHLPFENLGYAHVDTHRSLRTGLPEVIFAESKIPTQIVEIAERIVAAGGPLLATRCKPEGAAALKQRFPKGVHDPLCRTFHFEEEPAVDKGQGLILVISAGTSDIPVAGEAALTARLMGNQVETLYDVGVAGVHRLLEHRALMQSARVIVVVAGMEGALPSVVGGLVACPIVAVPTSVGYGASFHGLSALLGMLNSCAPGVSVVNIDNGFGAGVVAGLINREQGPEHG